VVEAISEKYFSCPAGEMRLGLGVARGLERHWRDVKYCQKVLPAYERVRMELIELARTCKKNVT